MTRVDALDRIAERRLQEAAAAGELERLPGAGRPLELEDLTPVAEELRGGYLLLKGAGVLPEEMELRKELLSLGDLLRACEDPLASAELAERRRRLALRYEVLMERRRRH